jgi:hypothetical protein
MNAESRSTLRFIPHLAVLFVLLVYSISNLMGQPALLAGAGDKGPIVGIAMVIDMVTLVFIILGLNAVCREKESYGKMVTFSLLFFLVQLGYMFFEYTFFAIVA